MKIVGVINHDNTGGAQKALEKLKLAFSSFEDVEFEIIYLYEYFCRERVMGNGTILVQGKIHPIVKHAKVILRLIKYFRANKTDAIVCFLPYANIVGAICGFLAGVKVRVISHRNPVDTYNSLLRKIDRFVGTTSIYSKVVCNSIAVKTSLKSYSKEYLGKTNVINNSISFVFDKQTPRLIEKLASSYQNSLKIVAVGRLSEQKNYYFAFQVIKNLDNSVFIIAGHGELEDELRSEATRLGISERVVFLGNISNIEIQYLLKMSDVYLQTSLYEGQSNSLLEALNAGCLIFSSDIPPQREVIVNESGNYAGFLFELDDPKKWAKSIIDVVNNEAEVKQYRQKALVRAREFSPSKTADAYLQLFKKA